jgi:hypothetical protein
MLMFDAPTREAAKCERLKLGPQQRRVNLGPSDLKDACRSIGSSRRFARRSSKVQKETLLCSDARDAEEVSDLGPPRYWVSFEPSDLGKRVAPTQATSALRSSRF